jgi:hypothetical protein
MKKIEMLFVMILTILLGFPVNANALTYLDKAVSIISKDAGWVSSTYKLPYEYCAAVSANHSYKQMFYRLFGLAFSNQLE